jgi:3-deoxy-manno-octulosonate cytidylyltransferase (CMP-KDO synthetase)
MKILGIIPSRLESSRIKQKPLKKVFGIPLIEHVYKRAKLSNSLDDLVVATDDIIVSNLIDSFGGNSILTSKSHKNGTERMYEVVKAYGDYDYYVLINGDEILLNPDSIQKSINVLVRNKQAAASILAIKFDKFNSPSDFKVVFNKAMELMYISRNDIPSNAKNKIKSMLKAYHLMAFKKETILDYYNMEKTSLEKIEDHEHLRLLENGYKIVGQIVEDDCISLDTYSDLKLIEEKLKKDKIFLEKIRSI